MNIIEAALVLRMKVAMRQVSKDYQNKFAIRGLIACTMFAAAVVASSSAQALDYSGEDHCFANNRNRAQLTVEDHYANGSLQDAEKIAAVETLTNKHWQLRLSNLPFTHGGQVFRGSFSNASESGFGYFDALTAILLDESEERRNRRSGSRYLYVKPQMKQLARERGQIRSLKGKPCNPHILYLG